MKHNCIAILFACVTATAANALECTVQEDLATPLNVRSRPNGPILGALHNGSTVFVSDLTADRKWAKIVPAEKGKSGWVFREYLICENQSTGRGGAPNTFGSQSCSELWHQRNSIYRAAGYCFSTQRAIATFGN